MEEILREFVAEAREHLERLEHDLVVLERDPADGDALANAFRAVHTIKGTCGFFGFARIEALAHAAESALDLVRDGSAPFTANLASRLLDAIDALRRMLESVESDGTDAGKGGAGADADAIDAEVRELADALERPGAAPVRRTGDAQVSSGSVRIDVATLDRLMDLVGELVFVRNRLTGLAQAPGEASDARAGPTGLSRAAQRLDRLTKRLQATVVRARLEPVGRLWGRFPRLVRDLAAECGKRVGLVLRGNETEVDRAVLEAIADPLTHLVRNSIDHGVEGPAERTRRSKPEEAVVEMRATQEGGQFVVEVSDDGRGVDLDRVRAHAIERRLVTPEAAPALSDDDLLDLLFTPGFSTAGRVTSLSGRGVGMDVVRTNVERLGGAVTLRSQPGRGLTTRIQLPLTLAIAPALVVCAGGERFVVPQASLRELVRVHPSEIEQVHEAPVYRLRGRLLPLVELAGALGLKSRPLLKCQPNREERSVSIAVVDVGPERAGLVVDDILDTREIVVKPPGRLLRRQPLFAGATILDDGRAALILDVARIAERVVAHTGHRLSWAEEEALFEPVPGVRLLLCRLLDGGRVGLRLDGVRRLEVFAKDAVERVGEREVVPYGDGLLHLVSLQSLLGSGDAHPGVVACDGRVHAVVCGRFGLAVESVEDVVEVDGDTRGTALVDGHATRIMTAPELIERAEAVS